MHPVFRKRNALQVLAVRDQRRHIDARLATLSRFERTADVEAFSGGQPFAAFGFLQMQSAEFRLGIEGVDMRRTAFHHQKDAPLCFGFMMRLRRRCTAITHFIGAQHGRQGAGDAKPAVDQD